METAVTNVVVESDGEGCLVLKLYDRIFAL